MVDVQTKEQEELYREHEPPGERIPIKVERYKVEDEVPSDDQIREAVKESLKNGRAERASKIHGEDIKGWLRGIEKKERDNNGQAEAGDPWRMCVQLVQTIWTTGEIPQQMLWEIFVLIPKGNGQFCGIGLLELIWKVVEILMERRLREKLIL